jgi:hypothetical protein
MPGFTAETSLYKANGQFLASRISFRPGIVEPAAQRGGGGPDNTCFEICRTVIVYEPCGSPLPGGLPPMCNGRCADGAQDTKIGSSNISQAEEAIVVAFRKHTLLPLDDCLSALQPTIPHSDTAAPSRSPLVLPW